MSTLLWWIYVVFVNAPLRTCVCEVSLWLCMHCWLCSSPILSMLSLSGRDLVDLESPAEQWANACCILNNVEAYSSPWVCACVFIYKPGCIISRRTEKPRGRQRKAECVCEMTVYFECLQVESSHTKHLNWLVLFGSWQFSEFPLWVLICDLICDL